MRHRLKLDARFAVALALMLGACFRSHERGEQDAQERPRLDAPVRDDSVLRLLGTGAGALTGMALAVGDATGDGKADLWIGAPGADSDCGRVALVAGPITKDGDLADGAETWTCAIDGGRAGEVLVAGDLEGDGVDEVLVGAPRAERATGAAYLVRARGAGTRSLSSADARFAGGGENDDLGRGLAIAEAPASALLVGVPHLAPGSAGGAFVWRGDVSGDVALGSADAVVRSDAIGAHAGTALDASCDADGDATPDVLVGAWGDDSGETGGAAYLFRGPIDGATTWDDAIASFVSDEPGAAAGSRVALADLDADGRCDVLVGAPGAGGSAGAIYGFLAPHGGERHVRDADLRVSDGAPSDGVGLAFAVGDQDGDGSLDLWVGVPGRDDGGPERGAVYVLHGPVSGAVAIRDLVPVLRGTADGAHFGAAIAAGADLDGDGSHDVAAGAWGVADGASDRVGAVYVLRNR